MTEAPERAGRPSTSVASCRSILRRVRPIPNSPRRSLCVASRRTRLHGRDEITARRRGHSPLIALFGTDDPAHHIVWITDTLRT